MELGLEGRTAIVCGASAGIGRAVAERLAAEGANVVMFARRRRLLADLARRLGALAVAGDLTVQADTARLVEKTVAAFGAIDIVVNNGGGPAAGAALDLTEEALLDAFALLVLSTVRLTNLALPHLRQSSQGRIINVASSAVREPLDNLVLSNALRPGVVGWAKTLAREVGPAGITVNTVAPGRIATARLGTDMPRNVDNIPLRRIGDAADVADVICFLASARASYVSGAVIPVDGGRSRSLL